VLNGATPREPGGQHDDILYSLEVLRRKSFLKQGGAASGGQDPFLMV